VVSLANIDFLLQVLPMKINMREVLNSQNKTITQSDHPKQQQLGSINFQDKDKMLSPSVKMYTSPKSIFAAGEQAAWVLKTAGHAAVCLGIGRRCWMLNTFGEKD